MIMTMTMTVKMSDNDNNKENENKTKTINNIYPEERLCYPLFHNASGKVNAKLSAHTFIIENIELRQK